MSLINVSQASHRKHNFYLHNGFESSQIMNRIRCDQYSPSPGSDSVPCLLKPVHVSSHLANVQSVYVASLKYAYNQRHCTHDLKMPFVRRVKHRRLLESPIRILETSSEGRGPKRIKLITFFLTLASGVCEINFIWLWQWTNPWIEVEKKDDLLMDNCCSYKHIHIKHTYQSKQRDNKLLVLFK